MTERPIYKSQTVNAVEVHVNLGAHTEKGLDIVSSRLIVLAIPPTATFDEVQDHLVAFLKAALKHCQAEAFPHG